MALPVPKIKEGIVKLPLREELSVDILVPPGMDEFVSGS